MEEEGKTLKETITELNENISLIKNKKKKDFKIPWRARVSKRKAKDNYVTVLYVKDNKNADFRKEKIVEQTIKIGGIPRLATGEHVLSYKGKPFIIQPSWSVKPFSPAQNLEDTVKENMNSNGYRILLNIMKSEAIKSAKKLGLGLSIGGIIILGVIVYALFTGA